METAQSWRRCSSCKNGIPFASLYWVCNVSTCNRPRTGLVFCDVSCWEAHVPIMRHRESWAVEQRSPRREEWERTQREAAAAATAPPAARAPKAPPAPKPQAPAPARPSAGAKEPPRDVLVVVSKLKAYIRARSGMSTSDAVSEVLSDALRALCDRAIQNARREGRTTVMERDFPGNR
jgi:hypothetical protein